MPDLGEDTVTGALDKGGKGRVLVVISVGERDTARGSITNINATGIVISKFKLNLVV